MIDVIAKRGGGRIISHFTIKAKEDRGSFSALFKLPEFKIVVFPTKNNNLENHLFNRTASLVKYRIKLVRPVLRYVCI